MKLEQVEFRTRGARKEFLMELMQGLSLCGSEQDINQLREDYKDELLLLKKDDEHNDTKEMPMYPMALGWMAERLETIKQREIEKWN